MMNRISRILSVVLVLMGMFAGNVSAAPIPRARR